MSKKEKRKKEAVESPSSEERKLAERQPTIISRGVDSLFDDFRRSFDDFMAPFMPTRLFWPEVDTGFPVRAPLVDVTDKGDSYVVKAELPGFKKDMIDVQLNEDTMVLKAEKRLKEEEKGENFIHRERSYTTCQRTINFPEEVEPSKVDAAMVDGVLELKVPKRQPRPEERMKRIQVR
jgi:HSP20 family protein